MATSITGSTNTPFNNYILQDVNYNVSASLPAAGASGSTGFINFNVANPFPTTTQVVLNVYFTALTNTSGSQVISASLQQSADSVTWVNATGFASPLLTTTDNGALAAPAATTQVVLGPNALQYYRVNANVPANGAASGGITGSFGLFLTM